MFVKADFRYVANQDIYICPADEVLVFVSQKRETHGLNLRRYATRACAACRLRRRCTTGAQRSIARWEYGHVLEDVQRRLDENPQPVHTRRETVEHPFGTIKARTRATHFLMKRTKYVATKMALAVLAYKTQAVIAVILCGMELL